MNILIIVVKNCIHCNYRGYKNINSIPASYFSSYVSPLPDSISLLTACSLFCFYTPPQMPQVLQPDPPVSLLVIRILSSPSMVSIPVTLLPWELFALSKQTCMVVWYFRLSEKEITIFRPHHTKLSCNNAILKTMNYTYCSLTTLLAKISSCVRSAW